ncbi:MAG: hypothetical protein V9E89_06980 [Ilumatobacteraceae bacterium]
MRISPTRRLERVQVHVPAAQPGAITVEAGEASGVDEDPPPSAGGDEPEDAGVAALDGGCDDDVVELADGRPAGVEQWQAHDPERVDQLPCHAGKATPRGVLGV